MDEDKAAESNNIKTHEEIKLEPRETADSPSLKSLNSPKPEQEHTNGVPLKINSTGNDKNGQKRMIKTEPDVRIVKKPRINTPKNLDVSKASSNDIEMSDSEEYSFTVSNLPEEWSYVQIKNYLDKECGHVDEMEMIKQKDSQNFNIRLTFPSFEKCKDAFSKLQDKVIEGKILKVSMSEPEAPPPLSMSDPVSEPCQTVSLFQSEQIIPSQPWRPDQDFWGEDPEGLYGLRPQFLTSLNITPPLSNLVHVSSFRCDKSELREVMGLAGNVIMCCLVTAIQKNAKVMYSHPIEAVQAISMLNGQMFYGSPLKITMDRSPGDTIILPKGLTGVGLGLGIGGRPIRNIDLQYQRFIKNQTSIINPILFTKITDNDKNKIAKSEEDADEVQKNINEFMKSTISCNLKNTYAPYKIKNIDELDNQETASKDGSDRSTPETSITKASQGGSRKSSIGSLSPNQDSTKKSSEKPNNNLVKPVLGTNTAPNAAPLIRITHPGAKNVIRPGLLQNSPVSIRNPLPVPTPGHPNYGPGPNNFGNPQRPHQFRPRPGPFIPPFGPQPMPPAPFGPGPRPPMPPPNFGGPRPFLGPNAGIPRPNMNPGNRVTVNFSNLPPSTTFPLLCDQLAKCGQVMSVQLTTPGCAVATFGHPSHAERCFQTFNRMNVEGYIIEVQYA